MTRVYQIKATVTQDELGLVKQLATEQGLTVSEYIRRSVLGHDMDSTVPGHSKLTKTIDDATDCEWYQFLMMLITKVTADTRAAQLQCDNTNNEVAELRSTVAKLNDVVSQLAKDYED